VERLDWMYAGLMSSKQAGDEKAEAAMNKPATLEEAAEENRVRELFISCFHFFFAEPRSTSSTSSIIAGGASLRLRLNDVPSFSCVCTL
jgi:hypothetical protein